MEFKIMNKLVISVIIDAIKKDEIEMKSINLEQLIKRIDQTVINVDLSTRETGEYEDWYTCPNCKSRDLHDSFEYCPACGIKLKFYL